MIPLRVLHAIGPEPGPAGDAASAQISWLVAHHHAAGVLTSSPVGHQLAPGVDLLPYRNSLLSTIFRTTTDSLRRVVAWVPDLIHVHDLRWLAGALELAHRLRLSVVVSTAGVEPGVHPRLLRDQRIGWVVAPSESHRAQCMARLGLPRDRVTYLPPGVDVAACGSVPYRIAGDHLVVGFTGPCDETSGIPRLADALLQLSRTHPVRGCYRPASPADAEQLHDLLTPAQLALIDLARVDGEGFTAGIDIFADLGTDDRIASPLFEAMACARPVLAMAWGSMPELVRHGQTALLMSPSDPDALLQSLRQLTDPAVRRELGEAGRELAAERYDIGLIGEALVELYRMAIGGTRNSSVKAEGSTVYRRISEARLAR